MGFTVLLMRSFSLFMIGTLPTLSTHGEPYSVPTGDQSNVPQVMMATGSPRFIGRRDTGTPKPSLLAEDSIDGGLMG